jgi:hypothetical protein
MAGLPIITADMRMAEDRGVKGCVFGSSGIGKTPLLWTLDAQSTLFIDLEAGDAAVEGWEGDTLRPRTWQECRDLAVFIGGFNTNYRDNQAYSKAHYDAVCEKYGDPKSLDKYKTFFIDSITVAGRLCLQWCKGQPQAFAEKSGKEDLRGAYGLHGHEMLTWLIHLQHTRNKNIWFVGILDEDIDEFKRRIFVAQIDGSKVGRELSGIIDQIITMAEIQASDGTSYRAFVCTKFNRFGYPAKDRGGHLEEIEEPHLGRLMEKLKKPARKPPSQRLVYGLPKELEQQPGPQPDPVVNTDNNNPQIEGASHE